MGGQICLFVSLLLMFLFLVPSKGWATNVTDSNGITWSVTYLSKFDECYLNNYVSGISSSATNVKITFPKELKINNKTYTTYIIGWNDDRVFQDKKVCSKISEIVIPNNITEVANYSLGDLTNLKKVTFESTTPPTLGQYIFAIPTGQLANFEISVPKGSESAYAKTTALARFNNSMRRPITDDNNTGITTDMISSNQYAAGLVTYERTFGTAGQYGSIALPFAVASSAWTQYFEHVYTLSSASLDSENKAHLEFSEVTGNMAANTPYFVKLKEGVSKVSFANTSSVTISSNALKQSTKVTFTGNDGVTVTAFASLKKETSTSSVQYYTFNADGTFGPSTEVYPFRMCLKIEGRDGSASAPALFSIDLPGGSTTGISGISHDAVAKTAYIYSIDGKLVCTDGHAEGLAKGVYVKNGKKFVVK